MTTPRNQRCANSIVDTLSLVGPYADQPAERIFSVVKT